MSTRNRTRGRKITEIDVKAAVPEKRLRKVLAEKESSDKRPVTRGNKSKENGVSKVEETNAPVVKKTTRGRKRPDPNTESTKNEIQNENENENEILKEQKKSKSSKIKAPRANVINTKYDNLNFDLDKKFNYKISSWNVAGIRSWITKGGLEYVEKENPDIFCLQEIKCDPDKLPDEARIAGYHPYWCSSGEYAGVALYSKIMPIHVEYGIGDEEQDKDGRILTAEYEKFFLVVVYVPNAGQKLITLPKRMRWDTIFHNYLKKLNEKKPVIITGDLNVAHNEIDLANPKINKKNAGFTKEERDGMTKLLSLGFIDTFRYFYPKKEKVYTFWSYRSGARAKNVGWRLDYFIVSNKLLPKVVDNVVRSEVMGSDHCPLTLFLKL